jgi:deoxyribodipyrimidine photolyase-related protein
LSALCLVLGDQLSLNMTSLTSINKETDQVLMAEVRSEATYVKHHKKKIAFIFSAMRHFSEKLSKSGYRVNYVKYDDAENRGSLFEEVKYIVDRDKVTEIVVAKAGEYRLSEEILTWSADLNVPVSISDDNRFMASEDDFRVWADGKKQFRMEFFYREMRRRFNILMDDKQPVGGKWNFDSDNRQKLPANFTPPEPTTFKPDAITKSVVELVKTEFSDHFGDIESFHYAVTREQALIVLDEFIKCRLPNFGTYQDAMVQDEAWMYHSHVSFYINVGLLSPEESILAAQKAYYDGHAPINSVEGFIRQILGWREYVRGFYWYFMPGLKSDNYLNAKNALPELFWTGATDMNCLSQSIKQTKEHAYAHHIQRLMVLGNFALLAGLDPEQVNEWYLIVYADAYEWVELPNVSGMVLYSDGGKLASKPYAASGAYINKMSNYCAHCHYSVKEKTGPQACPFNYLYWGFVNKHKNKLENNPRMAMIYRTMAKMDQTKLEHMIDDADNFIIKLGNNEKV